MDATRRWIPYCGEAPGPEAWLARWNLDPVLLAGLALLAWALWRPAATPRAGLRWAWGLAVLLYVSPLCALSSAFFTVRVAHHMALVLVIAPLLAQGLVLRRLPLWTCTALATAVFWAWHAPAPYAAALSSEAIYLALLVKEPELAPIHAERDLGKLLRFERLPWADLLGYFKVRRAVLLGVLEGLKAAQWARVVREAGKQRKESVYWRARGLALHEAEHVGELEGR